MALINRLSIVSLLGQAPKKSVDRSKTSSPRQDRPLSDAQRQVNSIANDALTENSETVLQNILCKMERVYAELRGNRSASADWQKVQQQTAQTWTTRIRDWCDVVPAETMWETAAEYKRDSTIALGDAFTLATAAAKEAPAYTGADDDFDDVDVTVKRFRKQGV
jgi:predicted nucleic acid-binding protein